MIRKSTSRTGTIRTAVLGAAALAIVSSVSIRHAAAQAEPIVLKLGSPGPASAFLSTEIITPWAEAVSADSQGTLKIQTFYGGTLGNFGLTYDRVVNGVADIGFTLFQFAAGKFKQQNVAALPFESKSSLSASTALWKLYERGITAGEFDAVKPLALWTFPNAALHSRIPIRTVEELRGKKVITSGAVAAKMVVALGAIPISLRVDETYTGLQRGTADSTLQPFTGMESFKIYEVTSHHLDTALGSDAAMLFINKARYESLPAPARAAIDRHSYLPLSIKTGRATDAEWRRARGLVADKTDTLSPDQEKQWRTILAPIAKEWADSVPNGAAVLEAFRAEVAAAEAAPAAAR